MLLLIRVCHAFVNVLYMKYRHDLDKAFDLLDPEDNGTADMANFKLAMKDFGVGKDLTKKELETLLRYLDKNGDGALSFDEFSAFMNERLPSKMEREKRGASSRVRPCVWAYVCVYVCIYVCMYVCMYVCVYVCMYVCMYVYMYV